MMAARRAVLLLAAPLLAAGLDNGLAVTPPMGWNPWNCFGVGRSGGCKLPLPWVPGHPKTAQQGGCHGFNETVILAQAAVMSDKLKHAGWEFMSLDCGYSTKRRDTDGNLVVNTTRYPHGMTWLGEQIHGMGLKFGMYAAQGISQCCSKIDPNATDGSGPNPEGAGIPSRKAPDGYYTRDAQLFASWEVDYLKFDGCAGPKSSIAAMRAALNATGRPIAYSINNGVQANNSDEANIWRTTPDTSNTYPSMIWTAMVNNNATQIVRGRPGAWNDADMLEVGNFFEAHGDAAGRTNFALWCLMKSPLILGTDLTNLTAATLATITAPLAISVSKDPLGEQGVLRESSCYHPPPKQHGPPAYGEPCGYQVWSGALSKGGAAAVLANLDGDKAQLVSLTEELLPADRRAAAPWDIVEAFSGKTVCRGCSLPHSAHVAPHDAALWVLSPSE